MKHENLIPNRSNSHREDIMKPTFRALALRQSECLDPLYPLFQSSLNAKSLW